MGSAFGRSHVLSELIWELFMQSADRLYETRLLGILLMLVAVFALWVIPSSVEDPEGFGYAEGLAPSFTVYLVAALAATILALRLIRVLRGMGAENAHSDVASEEIPDSQKRSMIIIGSCLVFAFLLIPFLGFYISSFAFVAFLAIQMGEQRVMVLTALPAFLIAGVYVGFELGFTIMLPRGDLVQLLLDAMDS
jgi:hypothetical protein